MAGDRMPWFKWWDGTAADMKFRMVAEDCKLPVACIVGAWAYILEHASRSVDRGSIADIDLELMAYTLQVPDCETLCNAMKRRKLLHEDGTITKWEDRQGKRERNEAPGSSTERVQRMRAKQKAAKESQQNKDLPQADPPAGPAAPGGNDETHVTAGNATKRPKKKNREEEDKEPKTLTPPSAVADDVTPFDRFWEAYPWNAGKQDAHKAWIKVEKNWAKLNKHAPDEPMLETLLAAVAAQKEGADWKREAGQYIPRAATWLNGGRWKDEVRPYVAPPLKLPGGWWETHDGAKAAGAMLTPPLVPNKGEYLKEFVQRIRTALGQVDAPAANNAQAAPVAPPAAPEQYIPPAVKDGEQLSEEERQSRRQEMLEQLGKMKQKGNLALAGVAAPDSAKAA